MVLYDETKKSYVKKCRVRSFFSCVFFSKSGCLFRLGVSYFLLKNKHMPGKNSQQISYNTLYPISRAYIFVRSTVLPYIYPFSGLRAFLHFHSSTKPYISLFPCPMSESTFSLFSVHIVSHPNSSIFFPRYPTFSQPCNTSPPTQSLTYS